jgi:hypothetical protein
MRQILRPHPDSPCAAVTAIAAEAARPRVGVLELRYVVTGTVDGLLLPPPATSARADQLWRHTCLEAFVRGASGDAYWELNLSPSTQWAAYRFDGYRQGMAQADLRAPPRIEVRAASDRFELTAALDLGAAALLAGAWRLGLSAVIEAADGRLSYWALAHPPGKPDFHHPDCFALELPAPDGP